MSKDDFTKWPFMLGSIQNELESISKSTDEHLRLLRDKQNKSDKVNQKMVKPYIRRVAKSLDNPLNTNPNMLWEVKRQNHRLLKHEKNPKLREKMVQEIIEADQQLIKNIDEETKWFAEEKEKVSKQIDDEKKKGK